MRRAHHAHQVRRVRHQVDRGGDERFRFNRTQAEGVTIVRMDMGGTHGVAVDRMGYTYTWDLNALAQPITNTHGSVTAEPSMTPVISNSSGKGVRRVTALREQYVVDCYASANGAAVVTAVGSLFAWKHRAGGDGALRSRDGGAGE